MGEIFKRNWKKVTGVRAPDSLQPCDVLRVKDGLISGSGSSLGLATTVGDLIVGTGVGTDLFGTLDVGSEGEVLTVVSGAPAWAAVSGGTGGLTPGSNIVVNNIIASGTSYFNSTITSGDATFLGNINVSVASGAAGGGNTQYISNSVFNSVLSGTTGVVLPPAPTLGQWHVIKDAAGIGGIIVDGSGITIDGLPAITMENQWESVTLFYNGSEWNIT